MNIEAPWAKVPLHVITDSDLTLGDVRVYAALDYLAGKRGWWYGSQEAIAKFAGVSEHTAIRAVATLRDKGYISTVKMGLEKRLVLKYFIHARVITPDASVTATDGTELVPEMAPTVTATNGSDKDTDLPQTQSIESSSSSAAFFKEITGRDPKNRVVRVMLENIDAAHPPECVAWAWGRAADKDDAWGYVQSVFNGCMIGMEGHGPRGSNGTKQVRRGAGKAVGVANGAEDDGW